MTRMITEWALRMIDYEHKFIFVHIPKTGGTSFVVALYGDKAKRTHTPFRVYERGMMHHFAHHWSADATDPEMHALLKDKIVEVVRRGNLTLDLADYRTFAIVRNPWDRTVSWYKNVVRDEKHWRRLHVDPGIDFTRFVRLYLKAHWALRPQTYWLQSWRGAIGVERVFRIEDSPLIWKQISEFIKVPISVGSENVASDRRPYQEFYNEETRDLVASAFAYEIARFGYSFEGSGFEPSIAPLTHAVVA